MMKALATSLMILLLLSGGIFVNIPFLVQASTEGNSEDGGSNDEGSEGGGSEGSGDTGDGNSNGNGNNETPEPEPEPEPEPIVPEPERQIPLADQPVHCTPEDPDCNGEIDPGFIVPEPEPLPYCDTPEGEAATSCHDRYDFDEVTGLYPCNDGSQVKDPLLCTAKEKPGPDRRVCSALGCPYNPPDPKKGCNKGLFLSSSGICLPKRHYGDRDGNGNGNGDDGTSGGGGQESGSRSINMVPKPGQALLKIFYEDAWSGSVSDGSFDSASYDGSGDSSIAFDCASGDIYSLTIQKGEDDHEVMILIVEDYAKNVLDQGQTSAEFGIVSLSGTC